MTEVFDLISNRYGDSAQLITGDRIVPVRAFVQPVTSFDKRYYKDVVTGAGVVSEMRYLYLGPAENDVSGCDEVVCRNRHYEVVSAEIVHAGNEKCCCWAILRRLD